MNELPRLLTIAEAANDRSTPAPGYGCTCRYCAFTAAFQPDVVLDLIDRVMRLEMALEEYRSGASGPDLTLIERTGRA